jgi:hypothetical protein
MMFAHLEYGQELDEVLDGERIQENQIILVHHLGLTE